jgi:hypothetical protein
MYYHRNPKSGVARTKKSRDKRRLTDWLGWKLSSHKQSALNRGFEFSITKGDLTLPEYCPILGIKLDYMKSIQGPDSPSLDRIDSTLGYIPGNVWVISHKANAMKNSATIEELRLFGMWALAFADKETTR